MYYRRAWIDLVQLHLGVAHTSLLWLQPEVCSKGLVVITQCLLMATNILPKVFTTRLIDYDEFIKDMEPPTQQQVSIYLWSKVQEFETSFHSTV